MGIERKSLSLSDQERIHTAIHESGHALVSFFNPHAKKLYKATIVARGGALGVVSRYIRLDPAIARGRRYVRDDQGEGPCGY